MNPHYENLAEEIAWFLYVNNRERVSGNASKWFKEDAGIIERVLAGHGIPNPPSQPRKREKLVLREEKP